MPHRVMKPTVNPDSAPLASAAIPFGNAVFQGSTVPADAPLAWHIERAIRDYLQTLQGDDPNDLYEVMLNQLEKPLLTVVLEHTRGNQSRTADILGLNRGTLRKKMKIHDLM